AAGAHRGIEVELLIKVAQMRRLEILHVAGAERRGRHNETASSPGQLVTRGASRPRLDLSDREVPKPSAGTTGNAGKTCRQSSIETLIGVGFKPERINKIAVGIHIRIRERIASQEVGESQ